jgi:hypothetical protein
LLPLAQINLGNIKMQESYISLAWLHMPTDVAQDLPHPVPRPPQIDVGSNTLAQGDPVQRLQQMLGQPELLAEVQQSLAQVDARPLWVLKRL